MPSRPDMTFNIIQPRQHGFYLADAIGEDLLRGKVSRFKIGKLRSHTLHPLTALSPLDIDQLQGMFIAQLQGEEQTGMENEAHMAAAPNGCVNPLEKNTLSFFCQLELIAAGSLYGWDRFRIEQSLILQTGQKGIEFAGLYPPDIRKAWRLFDVFIQLITVLGVLVKKT